jgi:hypothetical protein
VSSGNLLKCRRIETGHEVLGLPWHRLQLGPLLAADIE